MGTRSFPLHRPSPFFLLVLRFIMADFLNKKYKLASSENFDEYMSELKIGLTRKLGNSSTPVVEVTLNGDEYTLTTSSLLKTTTIKFKLGEEFEEERADG